MALSKELMEFKGDLLKEIKEMFVDQDKRIDARFKAQDKYIDFKANKVKEDILEVMNEKFGMMPIKDEFWKQEDNIMKEQQIIRTEQVAIGIRLRRHDEQIEELRSVVGLST